MVADIQIDKSLKEKYTKTGNKHTKNLKKRKKRESSCDWRPLTRRHYRVFNSIQYMSEIEW